MLSASRSAVAALCLSLALPAAPVAAQQLLASYFAYISWQDLFASDGYRLESAAQVIRQDRANFHRFGTGDPEDEWDPLYADPANRARLQVLVERGDLSPWAAQTILEGDVLIRVDSYGSGGRIDYVEIVIGE